MYLGVVRQERLYGFGMDELSQVRGAKRAAALPDEDEDRVQLWLCWSPHNKMPAFWREFSLLMQKFYSYDSLPH
jgi:hypothetical protein